MPDSMNDLAIPEIKLVQNVGGEEAKQLGAKPGDFYCAITQEIIPGATGFDIVVIKPAQKTRTYWGSTDISDEPPVCASTDGVRSINGDQCDTACPYKAFTDAPYLVEASERRAKCLPNYNIIAIQLSSMMPVMIRCSGISAMAARELNTLLKFHKVIRANPLKAKIKVTAVSKKSTAGTAFAIKFGQPVLIEDAAIIQELAGQGAALAGIQAPPAEEPATELPPGERAERVIQPQQETPPAKKEENPVQRKQIAF